MFHIIFAPTRPHHERELSLLVWALPVSVGGNTVGPTLKAGSGRTTQPAHGQRHGQEKQTVAPAPNTPRGRRTPCRVGSGDGAFLYWASPWVEPGPSLSEKHSRVSLPDASEAWNAARLLTAWLQGYWNGTKRGPVASAG